MAPVGYRRRGTHRRTRRTVKIRAVHRRRAGRYVDRIVEGDAAAEAELEAAGLRGDGAQTQVVTPLEIDPAVAVGAGVVARRHDAPGARAEARRQGAVGVALDQSTVERIAGIQAAGERQLRGHVADELVGLDSPVVRAAEHVP